MFPDGGLDTVAFATSAPLAPWLADSSPALVRLPIWKRGAASNRGLTVELGGMRVELRRATSRIYQGRRWGGYDLSSRLAPRPFFTLSLDHRYDGRHRLVVNRVAWRYRGLDDLWNFVRCFFVAVPRDVVVQKLDPFVDVWRPFEAVWFSSPRRGCGFRGYDEVFARSEEESAEADAWMAEVTEEAIRRGHVGGITRVERILGGKAVARVLGLDTKRATFVDLGQLADFNLSPFAGLHELAFRDRGARYRPLVEQLNAQVAREGMHSVLAAWRRETGRSYPARHLRPAPAALDLDGPLRSALREFVAGWRPVALGTHDEPERVAERYVLRRRSQYLTSLRLDDANRSSRASR